MRGPGPEGTPTDWWVAHEATADQRAVHKRDAYWASALTAIFGLAVLVGAFTMSGTSLRPPPSPLPTAQVPTASPISASSFVVRLRLGDSLDRLESTRLDLLSSSLRQLLPTYWQLATRERGRLRISDRDGDIEILLVGRPGTSIFEQHTRGGSVVSRSITVYTMEGARRLTVQELIATAVHELGHIWCCSGPGTVEGHWIDSPPVFIPVGILNSPMTCKVERDARVVCPYVFSDRELAQMGLR